MKNISSQQYTVLENNAMKSSKLNESAILNSSKIALYTVIPRKTN